MHESFLDDFMRRHRTLFGSFVGREVHLRKIIRYENYPHRLFPTNLNSHQHQVAALTAQLVSSMEFRGFEFSCIKAIIMAYMHDDHEPFMAAGDFQSGDKAHLNDEQKRQLKDDERQAINVATGLYPKKICGYSYGEMLWDAAYHTETIEAQLVVLADKLTGLSEASHEIFSGNETMSIGVESPMFGKMNVSPIQYYRRYFLELDKKLPLIMERFDAKDHWFLQPISEEGVPMQHYELWKTAILKYAPEWERKRLFEQAKE